MQSSFCVGASTPVRLSAAQLAHLLRKLPRRARQRRAHVPRSAQPLLLTQAVLQCVAAENACRDIHCVACRTNAALAWRKQARLLLPALCDG